MGLTPAGAGCCIHGKSRGVAWYHDNVIKWKLFPCNWPFVQRIHQSPVNPPTKASDMELWWDWHQLRLAVVPIERLQMLYDVMYSSLTWDASYHSIWMVSTISNLCFVDNLILLMAPHQAIAFSYVCILYIMLWIGAEDLSSEGIIFSCDEAALRTRPSVCLSVYLSVWHTFFTIFLSLHHHEIFRNFYHWKSDVHARGEGQISEVKVKEVKIQFSRFWTVTPVWIHRWLWNDAQSWKYHRKDPYCFSRSSIEFQGHRGRKIANFFTRIEHFRTVTPVWIHRWLWNDAQCLL